MVTSSAATSVYLSILILVACLLFSFDGPQGSKERVDLVVGVFSSRANFEQRETIRRTWMAPPQSSGAPHWGSFLVKPLFVVGDKECPLHPLHRKDPFSCISQSFNRSEAFGDQIEAQRLIGSICPPLDSAPYFNGFSFKIEWDIVVSALAVWEPLENHSVSLMNAVTKEIVTQTVADSSGEVRSGFRYQRLHPFIHLPKGFVVILLAENKQGMSLGCLWSPYEWDKSGLITYLRYYRDSNDYESVPFETSLMSSVNFVFSVAEKDKLSQHLLWSERRNERHADEVIATDALLRSEMDTNKDIMLLDLVDVYRNLPLKLVSFMDKAIETFDVKYLMKTDDDCYVNLDAVVSFLKSGLLSENEWWGNFRRLWALDFYGKWAENEYHSIVYPPFACGSGYVLTIDLIDWIIQNKNSLHRFQGEDVSLGIWMSAVIPKYVEDKRWFCDKRDNLDIEQLLAVPQLNTIEMEEMHESLVRKKQTS